MIGAGAVATRLLAGAWFGFDLLWVALYVVPMVDRHARLGVARRRCSRRARHARDGAQRDRAGWRGESSSDGVRRERRRQHEPDVGDGRRGVRRARHAASAECDGRLRRSSRCADGRDRGRGRARRLQARRENHDGVPARRETRLLHHRRDQGAARLVHVAGARRAAWCRTIPADAAGRRRRRRCARASRR